MVSGTMLSGVGLLKCLLGVGELINNHIFNGYYRTAKKSSVNTNR